MLTPSKLFLNQQGDALCNMLIQNSESYITYSDYQNYHNNVSKELHEVVLEGIRALIPFNSMILKLKKQFFQNVLSHKGINKKNYNNLTPSSQLSLTTEIRKRQGSMKLQRRRINEE
mmetsp:Transcript_43301/g.31616  ORF Transcript_43301/g.31616 Transcript_43301/m.31616 type:complete len:117 (+) Transcript_43301:547-897(+)